VHSYWLCCYDIINDVENDDCYAGVPYIELIDTIDREHTTADVSVIIQLFTRT